MTTISPAAFCDTLAAGGITRFFGVPDSLLKDLCAYLLDQGGDQNLIMANEGNAVAAACGYHLATGRVGAVYLQNSGLGNTVNPLLSLADPGVYGIPLLLIVGWRGQPGVPDEPQHLTQGRLTLPLLEAMEIPYRVLDPEDWAAQVGWAVEAMASGSRPVALVVRQGAFAAYSHHRPPPAFSLSRERALEVIVEAVGPEAILVTTTGKASRELFEIRARRGQGHDRDFLTVGSMGHASSIALGVALGATVPVYCLDGDGALLMHLGAAPVLAHQHLPHLRYVVLNNGAHESVGGQPTIAHEIDLVGLLGAAGFAAVRSAATEPELEQAAAWLVGQPGGALVVDLGLGARADLGRPSVGPAQNKAAFMGVLSAMAP